MNPDREYLAAGYVLGGLSHEDLELARSLEESDAEFRAEIQSFSETMALVGESDDPITPSAETDAAVLRIPQQHPRDTGAEKRRPAERPNPRRSGIGPGMFALAASVLFIVAGVLGAMLFTQVQQQQDIEESLSAAELERERIEQLLGAPDLASTHVETAGGGSVTVTYSMNQQVLHVVPHDVPPPEPDQAMQMWLIDEEGPHDLGLMSGDGAEFLAAVELHEGAAFGITIEPDGGSPEPTDEPIVVAEL